MNKLGLIMTNGLLITLVTIEAAKISPDLAWVPYILLMMVAFATVIDSVIDLNYDKNYFLRILSVLKQNKKR